jgi:replicative superfamily II helicase
MGILAGFIGIDRHDDPQVRDLTGAVRDATALWAIFSDSLPDIQAARLTDGEATRAGVEALFASTLDAAGPDDVVLLSFAGHGTRDHRVVLADTRFDDVPGTTIDMADLAARFRAAKARVVICLLDCCFSGGAPARVLDDGPAMRDGAFPLADVAGNGRNLFAASNVDEAALEDPVARHGLFTKAVLDCLQEAEAPVSILGVVEKVVKQVRAGAARQGYQQTPTVFGHIEGELSFPAIACGETFRAHFPGYGGVKVSADFADLAAHGIAQPILDLWAQRFAGGLNDLQRAAINEHGVLDGKSLLSVAPTSAGKTFIGELGAIKAVAQGEKAVFLLPYKALVDEKYEEFAELYGERLGLRVARCSGDWQDQTGAILRGKYDIAFFTYETFLGLAVAFPYLLSQIGLVVVDEAQFITDARRGIIVELLLTNLISARRRGVAPQIICLSAVIGNTNGFEKWLGCDVQLATERPVPLVEGVMDRSGVWQQRNAAGETEMTELLPAWDIRQRKNKPGSQDQIVPLVRKLVADGEKVIVFRNRRGPAAGCAAYLAAELGLPAAQAVIDALPLLDQSVNSQRLRECLAGGTAFHSTNLSREERSLVQAAFGDPDGPVRVLVATTTVAAGVNTPASTVIIAETEFIGSDGPVLFTVATYKNMAGRAGRLGYEDQGKAIVLADTGMERDRLYRRYVEGQPEPITSSFDDRGPETWLIRLLAQVRQVTRDQAAELIANTYGGYLANLAQPGWMAAMEGELRGLLARMEADGLVESEGDEYIRLSILGRACGQSPLMLRSAMRLIEMLRQIGAENLTPQNLMALVQALPEQDDRYTPMGRVRAEAEQAGDLGARFDRMIAGLLERRAGEEIVFLARCKRALILADWIGGVAMEDIENRYTANPFVPVGHGDIRGLADSTRFYLGSASEIAAIVHRGAGPTEEEMDILIKQLDLGLPADALGLSDLPPALERGEYLALYHAGARTADDVGAMDAGQLSALLGERRAEQIAVLLARRGEAE